MSEHVLSNVKSSHQVEVLGVLTRALSADPIERWMYPQEQDYLADFPKFLTAFTAPTFQSNSSYCINSFEGVALWLPPGAQLDEEAIVRCLERTLDKSKQADAFGLLEQMGQFHPKEPHWYLAIMGVEPAAQGKGNGSRLLEHSLSRCDDEHVAAYLESTNPRNVSLYERHGFRLMGSIQYGKSPPMLPMLRVPR